SLNREVDLTRLSLMQPATAAQRRGFYLLVTILAGLGWLVHALWQGTPVFPVDDAYITLHNAQVLHSGQDLNFPGSPALTGATSLLHTLLVAFLLLFLPPLWAMDVSLWIAIWLFGLGLARLAFVHRASVVQAFLLLTVGLTAARMPHQ